MTSKWNKIEHRLFCHITQNWRATPLTSRAAVVELIAATTTKTGLKVECALDERSVLTPNPSKVLSNTDFPVWLKQLPRLEPEGLVFEAVEDLTEPTLAGSRAARLMSAPILRPALHSLPRSWPCWPPPRVRPNLSLHCYRGQGGVPWIPHLGLLACAARC